MSKKRLDYGRTVLLTILALVLLFGSTLKDSLAYFTTYTTARGSYRLPSKPSTDIDEEVNGWLKEITIKNTGDTDCFVRVRALFGDFILSVGEEEELKGDGIAHWKKGGDGWWYFDAPLTPEESTSVLKIKFTTTETAMRDLEIDNFNVVIVQESAPVLYRANGDGTYTPYADWSNAQKVEQSEEAGS